MSFLLHIDTAVQLGSICVSKNEQTIGVKYNTTQNEHASWLQSAIKQLLDEHNIRLDELDAIAVSAGPGSYTGLRVSMATAKGLCYTLKKPLILLSTLKTMAAAITHLKADFFCPMIDARRMEVFTALYGRDLNQLLAPHNLILTDSDFSNFLAKGKIIFVGNGSDKFKPLLSHANAQFEQIEITSEHMVELAYKKFTRNEFADLAYSEPFYTKEFFSPGFSKT